MSSFPQAPVPGDLLTFWKQLLEKTRLQMSLFRGVVPKPGSELAVHQGALRWSYVVSDESSLVVLQVADRPDEPGGPRFESSAAITERLIAHRGEIETACGTRLIWRMGRREGEPALVSIWRVEDFGPGTTGDWPALQDALVDAMARLLRACRPYLLADAGRAGVVATGEPTLEGLPQRFAEELITACYLLGEESGYRPEAFLKLASRHGGLEAAHRVLQDSRLSEELETLRRLHRLEISVEAFALRPEYASLFGEEERQVARRRLRSHGYPV